jgi:hypothetical protein
VKHGTKRLLTGAAIATAAVVVIGGTATASSLITARQLATGSVNGRVIKDGSVHQRDLTTHAQKLLHQADGMKARIAQLEKQGATTNGQLQQGAAAIAQLSQGLTNLQLAVQALEPTPSGWSIDNDEGQITGVHSADLTETNDSTTGASLSNSDVNIDYAAGDPVSFKYTFSGGAAQGWGAPRVVVKIDGVWYTTIGNVHPNYGTKADGVWTQSNALVKFNDNAETPAPSGTITQIAVVYDNLPAPGTVHVHDLTVGDGQPLAFK